MVSNDDISFSVIQPNLQPIKRTYNTSVASVTHTYTVPAGKRWNFRGITLRREHSGVNEVIIADQAAGEIIYLDRVTSDILNFQPGDRLSLPWGWSIKANFNTAAAGWIVSALLIEEEIEY